MRASVVSRVQACVVLPLLLFPVLLAQQVVTEVASAGRIASGQGQTRQAGFGQSVSCRQTGWELSPLRNLLFRQVLQAISNYLLDDLLFYLLLLLKKCQQQGIICEDIRFPR